LSTGRTFAPLPKPPRIDYGARPRAKKSSREQKPMSDHAIPHFHNQPGLPQVRVGAKEFMCIGALPPFDHPHIYIDMGSDGDAICPYCSTHYVYDATLHGHSDPAECEAKMQAA
jgi:uncharacterized Zn-finger protein